MVLSKGSLGTGHWVSSLLQKPPTFLAAGTWVLVQITMQSSRLCLSCYIVQNHNIDSLQIYGDSKLVIDWMTDAKVVKDLELLNIGATLKEVSATFQDISFNHIYRENNSEVDHLSKDALSLTEYITFSEGIQQ
jgi:hypothetical protein